MAMIPKNTKVYVGKLDDPLGWRLYTTTKDNDFKETLKIDIKILGKTFHTGFDLGHGFVMAIKDEI
jgi:hypothetical protein